MRKQSELSNPNYGCQPREGALQAHSPLGAAWDPAKGADKVCLAAIRFANLAGHCVCCLAAE